MRNFRDMLKKALETGNSLHKGPLWGPWKGSVFRDFRKADEGGHWKRYFSY